MTYSSNCSKYLCDQLVHRDWSEYSFRPSYIGLTVCDSLRWYFWVFNCIMPVRSFLRSFKNSNTYSFYRSIACHNALETDNVSQTTSLESYLFYTMHEAFTLILIWKNRVTMISLEREPSHNFIIRQLFAERYTHELVENRWVYTFLQFNALFDVVISAWEYACFR